MSSAAVLSTCTDRKEDSAARSKFRRPGSVRANPRIRDPWPSPRSAQASLRRTGQLSTRPSAAPSGSEPSRRMHSPLIIMFSQMCTARAAYSLGLAEAGGERHRGGERLLRLLGEAGEHRRQEQAGHDGDDADAVARRSRATGKVMEATPPLEAE